MKNGFSRWQTYWISDRNDFSYFLSISPHNASSQVSSQLAEEPKNTIFKMAAMVER